jgi:hypothetical protein
MAQLTRWWRSADIEVLVNGSIINGHFALVVAYLSCSARRDIRAMQRTTAPLQRDSSPGLVFKTHVTPSESRETPKPPEATAVANGELPWRKWVTQHCDYRFDVYSEAVGQALGTKCREVRDYGDRQLELLKRELDLVKREAAAQASCSASVRRCASRPQRPSGRDWNPSTLCCCVSLQFYAEKLELNVASRR